MKTVVIVSFLLFMCCTFGHQMVFESIRRIFKKRYTNLWLAAGEPSNIFWFLDYDAGFRRRWAAQKLFTNVLLSTPDWGRGDQEIRKRIVALRLLVVAAALSLAACFISAYALS